MNPLQNVSPLATSVARVCLCAFSVFWNEWNSAPCVGRAICEAPGAGLYSHQCPQKRTNVYFELKRSVSHLRHITDIKPSWQQQKVSNMIGNKLGTLVKLVQLGEREPGTSSTNNMPILWNCHHAKWKRENTSDERQGEQTPSVFLHSVWICFICLFVC